MAWESLKVGDRVRLVGAKDFVGSRQGKVVEVGSIGPGLIRVKRDGLKKPDTWKNAAWEKVETDATR